MDERRLSCTLEVEPPLLRCAGEVDAQTSSTFRSALGELGDASTDRLVVDLEAVTFMDSSGLSALVDAATTGRQVILRRPSTMVRRIVEMTGLTPVLSFDP